MYDFVVVGGGIAGLELGAMLGHDNNTVLVLEQSEHIGGRSFVHTRDGFTLDNGIHLVRFGKKSAVAKVMRHIGHGIGFVPLGPSYLVDGRNDFILFPTGPSGFLKSRMFSFRERLQALGVMVKLKMGKDRGAGHMTVEDWINRKGIRGGLERYFGLVCASMLVCPITSVASAEALIENVNRVLKTGISVEYPSHGWQRDILEPLAQEIKKKGEIRTGVRVDSVIVENGTATGVRVRGETIHAKNVILDMPSRELGKVLDVSGIRDERMKTALRLVPTSGVSLDFAIDGRITGISGLIYLEDPVSFGCCISNIWPETAPPGKSLLTWFCPVQHEEMKLKDQVQVYRTRLENRIEAIFPELKTKTLFKRALFLDTVDGVELNINQLREKRLPYALSGIANLYLAGDTTAAPGAGGDIAHESSIGCYERITGKTV